MTSRSQINKHLIFVNPRTLTRVSAGRSPWYETPEETEAGLAWGKEKARLLTWVRRQMRRSLTLQERRCLELHFFKGLSCHQVASQTQLSVSAVHRNIQRGLRKIRSVKAARRQLNARKKRGIDKPDLPS